MLVNTPCLCVPSLGCVCVYTHWAVCVCLTQGEKILRSAEMCRKLETEEEKVSSVYPRCIFDHVSWYCRTTGCGSVSTLVVLSLLSLRCCHSMPPPCLLRRRTRWLACRQNLPLKLLLRWDCHPISLAKTNTQLQAVLEKPSLAPRLSRLWKTYALISMKCCVLRYVSITHPVDAWVLCIGKLLEETQ